MKIIVHNDQFLKPEEVAVYRHKVRAFIVNDKNEVAITNYGGIYMLPGGKAEPGEQELESLIREIKEEVGLDLSNLSPEPFVNIKNYLKNYPHHREGNTNRVTDTTYYFVKTNQVPQTSLINLTAGESIFDFKVEWVPISKVKEKIDNYQSDNPRKDIFDRDLLTVLAVYQKEARNDMNRFIDLHTHSYYSDGELSPDALLEFAKSEGIGTISITDHDSVSAYHFLNGQESISGINLIPGIELTAKTDKGRMHILGLGIDVDNQELNLVLKQLKTNNLNKIIAMITELKKTFHITFTFDEIKSLVNANHNLGRPDLARLCVSNGYANSVEEAFELFLNTVYDKTRAYAGELTYTECINLIKQADGVPILAHPVTLKRTDIEFLKLLKDMIESGLMGLEVYHPKHSPEDISKYLAIANDYNLYVSGGSDYHGPFIKPEVEIGRFNNKQRVRKVSVLDRL